MGSVMHPMRHLGLTKAPTFSVIAMLQEPLEIATLIRAGTITEFTDKKKVVRFVVKLKMIL